MCGIAGLALADPRREPSPGVAARMGQALGHRGPDGSGQYLAPGVALAVRRLAIVDIPGGQQPIANEDGTLRLICNGEIYNHVALRAALQARGHRFRTRSDVEVILHLYEDEGVEAVRRLRGMFALALWDIRQRRLWLARDRLGIKPLHYAVLADGLYFGSEQKAILAAGVDPGGLDLHALDNLFQFGFALEPLTFFTRIRQLRPGYSLVYEQGQARINRYWSLEQVLATGGNEHLKASEWGERLRDKLIETVRLHCQADVPVGALLSAGVDSSAVASLAAGHRPGLPTYTLTFADPAFDETVGQRTLDQVRGMQLLNQRVLCADAAFAREPEVVWHTENPTTHPAMVPLLLLGEAASRQVKVVLTGEGSDELFGGYPWFRHGRLLHWLRRLPNPIRRAAANLQPVRDRWPEAPRVLPGARAMDLERYATLIGHTEPATRRALFRADVRAELARSAPPAHRWEPAVTPGLDPFTRIQYLDLSTRLPAVINLGLDRTSMAFGVEARPPFLDHELVELAARIPSGLKMRRGWEKAVLREALQGLVPDDIRWRRKRGLTSPVVRWLGGPLSAFADAHLSPAGLRETGVFDPAAVAALREGSGPGAHHRAHQLLGVLRVQLWHQLFRRDFARQLEDVTAPAADSR